MAEARTETPAPETITDAEAARERDIAKIKAAEDGEAVAVETDPAELPTGKAPPQHSVIIPPPPSRGRIVEYQLPDRSERKGESRAAIITAVHGTDYDAAQPCPVNLSVCTDQDNDFPETNEAIVRVRTVSYDPYGKPGTWRWPARV